jgi:hypothetical protein
MYRIRLPQLHGFAGEPLRVGVIAARRVDARLHLPPERLCPVVVLVADFAEPANLRGCRRRGSLR